MLKKRVFIVDDEPAMIEMLTKYLESASYSVESDTNPKKGIERIRSAPPDLILLDICIGEANGLDICRDLKTDPKMSSIPIIMVSFKSEEVDVVLGLEMGAEDYIPKPFRGRELLARVRTVLRRSEPKSDAQRVECGPLRVDFGSYTAWMDGKEIDLTPKQFELLGFFLRMEGRVLTRRVISETVWGADLSATSRGIDSAVDQLRRKLGSYRTCIVSLKGVGYRFEVEDFI